MRARYGITTAIVGAAVLAGGTSCSAPSDQPLVALDHSVFGGPLMGHHELIDTIPIDNKGDHPLHLDTMTLTAGRNARVIKAVVITASDRRGIEGVLRWPRPPAEKDPAFDVLRATKPARGFKLPAHSHSEWALTLFLEQSSATRSMRASGVTVTYTSDGHQYRLDMTQGFCFSTPSDSAACKTD